MQTKPIRIGIIIDDLGNNLKNGLFAVSIPGQITYAILPHRPFTKIIAKKANAAGKQIMVHVPMQAVSSMDIGAGGLTKSMTAKQIHKTLVADLHAVPHAKGFNNHMGSALTADTKAMGWVMQTAAKQKFYFVDSRTTIKTVAEKTAKKYAIPTIRRNVFLDDERNKKYIDQQFKALIRIAKQKGYAVAIGHPHPITLRYLKAEIPKLERKNIKLVAVSKLITRQHQKSKTKPTKQYKSFQGAHNFYYFYHRFFEASERILKLMKQPNKPHHK